MNQKQKIRAIWVVGIALLLFGALCFFAVQLYVTDYARPFRTTRDDAPVCDAILVLGARVYDNGEPSPVLKDRLDYALDLYQAGKAPKIIVSGDHGTQEYDEVNAMLNYLLAHSVPRADIFLDHAGFNTYDSVYRARDIFCCRSVLISTQDFHMDRSIYIARSLGLDAYGVPSPNREIYHMAYNYIREGLARAKAIMDTEILQRGPKYLGDPIPVWGDGTLTDG